MTRDTLAADARRIREHLPARAREALAALEVFATIGSTNDHLKAAPPPAPGRLSVALAGHQSAGRGRHDRRWLSPAGEGVWLSLAYTFETPPAAPAAVTLALGAGVAGLLQETGVDDIRLKWPNDLLVGERKLGGLLVEAGSGRAGTLVCGLGLNTALSADAANAVEGDHRPVGLHELLAEPPERLALSAALVAALHEALERYGAEGLAPFAARWAAFDALAGRAVSVEQGGQIVEGEACGIDADGALLVRTEGGVERIYAGTVRRRAAAPA